MRFAPKDYVRGLGEGPGRIEPAGANIGKNTPLPQ